MPNRSRVVESTAPLRITRFQQSEEERGEQLRLDALASFDILDTPPDPALDRLTKLASIICGVPISLVSLIDQYRQWFKSKIGLQTSGTERELSFCQHALASDNVYEINDATQVELFRNNPFVTGDPNIRFYAGAPLITNDGHRLGTLCVIDSVPRKLTNEQRDALQILSQEVVAHLELRKAKKELEIAARKLDGVMQLANAPSQQLYIEDAREIFVKQNNKLVKVPVDSILWVEALGDYVSIHTPENRFTVNTTMKEIEARLPQKQFIRIQRSFIVRQDQIEGIEEDQVILNKDLPGDKRCRNGQIYLPIGTSYRQQLFQRLHLI